MQPTDVVAQLKNLNDDSAALLMLVQRHGEQIDAVLALIEPPADGPAMRKIALRYMRGVSNAQLRRDVIEARGERGAACFRTKLNSDLEALAGRRHPVAGQARVNGNGSAHSAA